MTLPSGGPCQFWKEFRVHHAAGFHTLPEAGLGPADL